MGLSRRQFTKEFKLAAVRRLEQGVSVAEGGSGSGGESERATPLAAGVPGWPRQRISGEWQAALAGGADCGVGAEGRPTAPGDRFFEGLLAVHRAAADAAGTDWKSAICRKIEEEIQAQRGLTVKRMVELGGMSRASFYRFGEDGSTKVDRDMDLRDAIQRIALQWPSYSRPRIAAELKRGGRIRSADQSYAAGPVVGRRSPTSGRADGFRPAPEGVWMMSGNGVGGRPFTVSGKYLQIDRPRLLTFTWLPSWQQNAYETTVRFDLAEANGSTTVRLNALRVHCRGLQAQPQGMAGDSYLASCLFRKPVRECAVREGGKRGTVRVRYMLNDVDRAASFYAKYLGFDEKPGAAPNFAMLSRGNHEHETFRPDFIHRPDRAGGTVTNEGVWTKSRRRPNPERG